jgi:dihydroorotate dehydrogenase (NAD+) catalytic subunit
MRPVSVGGLSLSTPILNASGTFSPETFARMFPLNSALGAIVTKTVTPLPTFGNPQQRTAELPGIGMLNSIGLQNPGLAYTLAVDLPTLAQRHGLPVVLSISATSIEGFVSMVAQCQAHASGASIAAYELNLSCPNVDCGGMHFGSQPDSVSHVVAAVVAASQKPVWAKLTPNVSDIVSIGQAAVLAGAQGLTAINTVMGAAINIRTGCPQLARVSGGYSGPGIKPVAVHAIYSLYAAMARGEMPSVSIIGVGGIVTANDVLEFLMAGASLVQVGTSCFRDPMVFPTLTQTVGDFCQAQRWDDWQPLVGCAHRGGLSAGLQVVQ